MMVCRAPAKVNLQLAVLARDTGGFHQLETVFLRLEFADELIIERSARGISLDVAGADVGPTEDNLAYRAAVSFFHSTDAVGGVRIELHKRIPPGAGLGGGSSDAAATLRALNDLYGQPLSTPQLLRAAADLGSDVPFFASGAPLALAWGRGERLLTLPALPVRHVILALPTTGMATAAAYAALDETRDAAVEPTRPRLLALAQLASWEDLAAAAGNDFEPLILGRHPRLRAVKEALLGRGAQPAMLSGSGSALFGVFRAPDNAASAATALRAAFPDVRIVVTRTAAV